MKVAVVAVVVVAVVVAAAAAAAAVAVVVVGGPNFRSSFFRTCIAGFVTDRRGATPTIY